MTNPDILISYDGGDANDNAIDARLYGQSLQGLDRMVSDCLIIISESRLPKRGDRAKPEKGKVKRIKAKNALRIIFISASLRLCVFATQSSLTSWCICFNLLKSFSNRESGN